MLFEEVEGEGGADEKDEERKGLLKREEVLLFNLCVRSEGECNEGSGEGDTREAEEEVSSLCCCCEGCCCCCFFFLLKNPMVC